MRAIALIGDIDEQHQLCAQAPEDLTAGRVRLIVLVPEDDAGNAWAHGVATAWGRIVRSTTRYLHCG